MDALEAIYSRRSIKKYSDKPVEFEKLMLVCEAGNMAPSSGNVQNWRFCIIRDKDKIRNEINNACLDQECFNTAQAAIVVCADEEQCERQYGLRGKRLYSIQNCAAAIENMLLAAHSLGLGACWIGAFNEERINSICGIPEDVARAQGIITLGYPDEEPGKKRMKHLDDVVRFEDMGSRYKDLHLVLKDFSVEWEKRANQAREKLEKGTEGLLEKAKGMLKDVKKKFEEQFGKDGEQEKLK